MALNKKTKSTKKSSKTIKLTSANRNRKRLLILMVAFVAVGVGLLIRSFAATPQPFHGAIVGTATPQSITCYKRNSTWYYFTQASACANPVGNTGYLLVDGHPLKGDDGTKTTRYESQEIFKYESGQRYRVCFNAAPQNGFGRLYAYTETKDVLTPANEVVFAEGSGYTTQCTEDFVPKVQDKDPFRSILFRLDTVDKPFMVGGEETARSPINSLRLKSMTLHRNPGWQEGRTYGKSLRVNTTAYPASSDPKNRQQCSAVETDQGYKLTSTSSEIKDVRFSCPTGTSGSIRASSDSALKEGKTYTVCSKIHVNGISLGAPVLTVPNFGPDTTKKELTAPFVKIGDTSDYLACIPPTVALKGRYYSAYIPSSPEKPVTANVFYISLMERVQ